MARDEAISSLAKFAIAEIAALRSINLYGDAIDEEESALAKY